MQSQVSVKPGLRCRVSHGHRVRHTTSRPVFKPLATAREQHAAPSQASLVKGSAVSLPATPVCMGAAALLLTLASADPAQATVLDAAAVHSISDALRVLFTLFTFLYIVRIPMTWYPDINPKDFPWALAYGPTEPVLAVTRKIVPLVGGVDVTPIVWVALLSFFNEILLGPQGLLVLIERQGGI